MFHRRKEYLSWTQFKLPDCATAQQHQQQHSRSIIYTVFRGASKVYFYWQICCFSRCWVYTKKNKMSYRHTYLHVTVFIKPRKACFRTKNIDYHKICLVRNLSKSNGSKSGSSFSCNDNAYNNNDVHKLLLRTCIMKFQFLWILCVRTPCVLSHMYTTAVINDSYYLV